MHMELLTHNTNTIYTTTQMFFAVYTMQNRHFAQLYLIIYYIYIYVYAMIS